MRVTSDTRVRFFALLTSLLLGFFSQASAQNGAELAAAVEMTEYPIFTTGRLPWEVVTEGKFDGVDAIRSPSQFVSDVINPRSEISFYTDAGTLSFYAKTTGSPQAQVDINSSPRQVQFITTNGIWNKFEYQIPQNHTLVRVFIQSVTSANPNIGLFIDSLKITKKSALPQPLSIPTFLAENATSFTALRESFTKIKSDSLFQMTAIVSSEPENAQLGLSTGETFRFFVTDTSAAHWPNISGSIPARAVHFDLLRDLKKGEIVNLIGIFRFDFSFGPYFEFSRYEKVTVPEAIYTNRYMPLLSEIEIEPDELNSPLAIGGKTSLARFLKYGGRNVSIKGAAFTSRQFNTTTANSVLKNGVNVNFHFISSRFGSTYTEGFFPIPRAAFLNYRRFPDQLLAFPKNGDRVNVRGFVQFTVPDTTLTISPWNDGVLWLNNARTTPENWPNDIEVVGSGVFLDSLRLSPTIPQPTEKPIAQVLVQNAGETPVDSVVLSYSIDNVPYRQKMIAGEDASFTLTLPSANNFSVLYRLDAVLFQGGIATALAGTFQTASSFRFAPNENGTVIPFNSNNQEYIGHFNNDAILDLALVGFESIDFFAGTVDGTFDQTIGAIALENSLSNSPPIQLFDVDQDGIDELIHIDYDNTTFNYSLFIRKPDNPDGTKNRVKVVDWYFLNTLIKIVDYDGDSDFDVIYRQGNVIYVLKNNGQAGYETKTLFTATSIRAIVVAEMNGDNRHDIVINDNSVWRILTNTGDGNFSASVVANLLVSTRTTFWVDDIDGDGFNDIMLIPSVSPYFSRFFLYKNLGNGQFSEGLNLFGTTNSTLTITDIDSDGDKDFIRSYGTIEILAYENNAVKPSVYLTSGQNGYTVRSAADFDQDGDNDLMVIFADGNSGDYSLMTLENQTDALNTRYTVSEVPTTRFAHEETATVRGWFGKSSAFVSVGGLPAPVISKSARSIQFSVPDLAAGRYPVSVSIGDSVAVSSDSLRIVKRPIVKSIWPRSGNTDSLIFVRGSFFGSLQKDGFLFAGDSLVKSFESWTDTLVTFRFPAGLPDGIVPVLLNAESKEARLKPPFVVNSRPSPVRFVRVLKEDSQLTAVWRKNADADFQSYRIWTGTDSLALQPVTTVSGRSDTTGSAVQLTNGLTYYVRLESVDSLGLGSVLSHAKAVVPAQVPTFKAFSATLVTDNDTLRVRGRNFGATAGQKSIFLGSISLNAIGWTDTLLTLKVPTSPAFVRDNLVLKLENDTLEALPRFTYVRTLPVWPGDTNRDSLVDALDLFPIGRFYGDSTRVPVAPSTLWSVQPRIEWAEESGNPQRFYADANGDGTIDAADILPLGLNYGLTPEITAPAGKFTPKNEISFFLSWTKTGSGNVRFSVEAESFVPIRGFSLFMTAVDSIPSDVSGNIQTDVFPADGRVEMARKHPKRNRFDLALAATSNATLSAKKLLSWEGKMPESLADSTKWKDIKLLVFDQSGAPIPTTWRWQTAEATSAEQNLETPVFALDPAYPNPFNPTTNIRFRLAESARVQLDVFDLNGRRVAQLVNQLKEQGTHTFTFDARHLSSGLYLYKITALPISGKTAAFTQVRKMVLVK